MCNSKGIQRRFPSTSSEGLTIQDKSVFWMSHTRKLIEDNEMYWDMTWTKQVQVGMSFTIPPVHLPQAMCFV